VKTERTEVNRGSWAAFCSVFSCCFLSISLIPTKKKQIYSLLLYEIKSSRAQVFVHLKPVFETLLFMVHSFHNKMQVPADTHVALRSSLFYSI